MKPILISLIVLFIFSPLLWGDDYSLVNLDIEAFSAALFGDIGTISSGALLDLYFGFNVLLHAGIQYCYDIGYTGFIPEAGIGIVVSEKYNKRECTTMTFMGTDYDEFGREVDVYWIRKETCYAADLHMIEAGAFAYLLNDKWYAHENEIYDVIFYGGYRFSSFYEIIAPLEEINFHAYALLGLVGRYSYVRGEENYDEDRLAFGVMCGVRWYLAVFDLAFYDGEFVLKAGFRIPITFFMR